MFIRVRRRLLTVAGVAALGAGAMVALPTSGASASTGGSSPISYYTANESLQDLGPVSLPAIQGLAGVAPSNNPGPSSSNPGGVQTPLGKLKVSGSKAGAIVSKGSFSIDKGNVVGESGFPGLSAAQNSAVNGYDDEPPDQGGCVGPNASGQTVQFEIINNAFAAYNADGSTAYAPTATGWLFNQGFGAFLSDPRCMYDPTTQRWFFTEFNFTTLPTTQYVAVSQTSDPFGTYEVFGIDTTDPSAPGCPCFGDFDQIGADANGFYIATNEFGAGFNGAVIYAVSKQGIEAAADGSSLPNVVAYHVTGDAFGQPYHVSPASTPQGGSFAPNTEFFVESNSNAYSDSNLLTYALTGTNVLATGGTPTLSATEFGSEAYGLPPLAQQQNGPLPLGSSCAFGCQTTAAPLQTDFNAIQEVTYSNGSLYAEADTAIGNPFTATNAGAAWFIVNANSDGTNWSASLDKNGYVANGQNLLYPDIIVNGSGNGYMDFTLAGSSTFPTPAYVQFSKAAGPIGTLHQATPGVSPEDGFTCTPDFGSACRWGDYSGGQYYNGRTYMMTEYIGNGPRDFFANWQTYVWSAPTK